MDTSLRQSKSPILRKLSEYETACRGAVVDQLMIFAAMPRTMEEAVSFARYIGDSLRLFAAHHIPPLVLFEPSMADDFKLSTVHQGQYDDVLRAYYKSLHSQGISEDQMGTWVLFPEANTPIWRTTRPSDFVANVTHVGKLQKEIFPESKLSILLGSQTYPDHDIGWTHGEFRSLAPYVTTLPKGLIDSFGYQGFPSASERNAPHQYRQFDARDFLPVDLALEAAKLLDVQKVWVNSGTFSTMYAGQPGEVRVDVATRRDILDGILTQAKALQAGDLSVSVNIFAEDKSFVNEKVDWSYWSEGDMDRSPYTEVLRQFIYDIRKNDLGFSLYDSFPTSE